MGIFFVLDVQEALQESLQARKALKWQLVIWEILIPTPLCWRTACHPPLLEDCLPLCHPAMPTSHPPSTDKASTMFIIQGPSCWSLIDNTITMASRSPAMKLLKATREKPATHTHTLYINQSSQPCYQLAVEEGKFYIEN